MIVQRLQEIQDQHHGILPDAELIRLAQEQNVPLYRIQELVSFFPHFRPEWMPPPYLEVLVCRDMSCHLAGSADWIYSTDSQKGLADLASEGKKKIEIKGVSCLGRCDRPIACAITRHDHESPEKNLHNVLLASLPLREMRIALLSLIDGGECPNHSDRDKPSVVVHPSAEPNNWVIDIYNQTKEPPYETTRKFLKQFRAPRDWEKAPKELSDKAKEEFSATQIKTKFPWLLELKTAYLQGMGGAGELAYQKWLDVLQAESKSGVKYVIGNGDESEPGTFKDRALLLEKPHLVVEGLLLACLIVNAKEGFIYIRHEYGEQIEAVAQEMKKAEAELQADFDKDDIDFTFPKLAVFVSPGGYVCGEQSALVEAMEGKRAQPRNKPPELKTNGFNDCPTIVNNVETLAWAPAIFNRGGAWYAGLGHGGCKGQRFFSISGDVQKPGVFEVPIGISLGELIDRAGGLRAGRKLQAVATSGPSGGFLPSELPLRDDLPKQIERAIERFRSEELKAFFRAFAARVLMPNGQPAKTLAIRDLPLDMNVFQNLGMLLKISLKIYLGAGLAVYDDTRNMLREARNGTQFFRNESCGKCVPCRIGSQKLVEIATTLLENRPGEIIQDADRISLPMTGPFMVQYQTNLASLWAAMDQTSICSLGQVAANPLLTALTFFPKTG